MQSIAQFAIFGTLPPAGTEIKSKYRTVKENISKIRRLGSSVRCDVVSTAEEYASVLRIRHQAYKHAGKVDENLSVENMGDDYDTHSVILAARIDGAIVGTVRLVECKVESQKFPFEEYLKYSTVFKTKNKNELYEVSKLAIDPSFQGTDIVIRLFKEVARINGINRKTPICLSTKALRILYTRMGFKVISKEIPHPVLKNETMALMIVVFEDFLTGKNMSATVWDRVSREVGANLRFANINNITPSLTTKKIVMRFEKYVLGLDKIFKSKKIGDEVSDEYHIRGKIRKRMA